MGEKIRVALVDDHPMFRECVASALTAAGDIEIVGRGGSAAEAIDLARALSPDVILLDITMPGGGLQAAGVISETCPGVRVLMLTASEDEEDVERAFKAGVLGYVVKGVSARELARIVRDASENRCYVSPSLRAA